ncbi:MAG: asparaginase [Candidatus Rokubacteria bacterium]|nr:asparaginase [Candidatus Rokubacteria bacterium]
MNARTRPRVAVIGTGGTISSVGRDSLDVWEYMDHSTRLEADELVAGVPELAAVADVVAVRHRALGSPAIGPKDWLELGSLVHDVVAREAPLDGIVITHGTATLEETAYFLNLTARVDVPIVLVGSQRPFSGLSSDARMNLVGAVRVAGAREARGLGVLVLLNDEIQAARDVTKTSTLRLETFRSADVGMLGYADPDGRVALYRRPTRRHAPDTEFDVRRAADLPRVDIAYSYAGADGTAIAAFVAAGARAVVSASMAPGTTTKAEMDALLEARRGGVLAVLSSRAGSGRVLRRTVFRERGIVVADNLTPQKARVLAMLALTVTDDVERLQRMFDEY